MSIALTSQQSHESAGQLTYWLLGLPALLSAGLIIQPVSLDMWGLVGGVAAAVMGLCARNESRRNKVAFGLVTVGVGFVVPRSLCERGWMVQEVWSDFLIAGFLAAIIFPAILIAISLVIGKKAEPIAAEIVKVGGEKIGLHLDTPPLKASGPGKGR